MLLMDVRSNPFQGAAPYFHRRPLSELLSRFEQREVQLPIFELGGQDAGSSAGYLHFDARCDLRKSFQNRGEVTWSKFFCDAQTHDAMNRGRTQ